ncbi:A disintegrin and metalloproteinase with thrombospondin motifs like [Dermacentor variabilis]|uniref:A disintegrin and metalloproteinase with thrombospondin motifs like n=1 Tax=Dermacentor variabilis TaxID=34621 RepID=UPI003F5B92B4
MTVAVLLWSLLCNFGFSSAMREYGIVYPTLLSARGSDEEKSLRINEHMTLNLKKSEVFTDDFMFISEENGERIHLPMRKDNYEKDLYHDAELMSSVVVRTDDGVSVEGLLNDTLRIKPLLERSRSSDGRIPHKLYEMPPKTDMPPHHRDYKSANVTARDAGFTPFLEERSTRKTYYPEIHIVQDYAHAQAFGFKKADVILYFAVFCNAVNIRYALNKSPKIQLRIAAITMSTKVEQYLVYAGQNKHQILDEETLAKFNSYYKTKAEFTSTDLTYLITGLDMAFYENGNLQAWVGGYSYVGGFCQTSKVGMSEDPPASYFGVTLFAHEIGHSLGCVHDGNGAISHLPGHKGSTSCPWGDGYMMSYERKNRNQYKFSPCCIADIKNLLRQSQWVCLKKRQRKSIKRYGFPGQYVSGNDYCRRVYSTIPDMQYKKEYGIVDCKARCEDSQHYYLIAVPDGVPCDQGRKGRKRCFLGKCAKQKDE